MTSWYCNICDISKHPKSKSPIHKENYSILVKVYEFDDPDIKKTFSIIENCARDCHNKYNLRLAVYIILK